MDLICSNLTFPTYDSHDACYNASRYCTFSSIALNCVDYICSNVEELSACSIDSNNSLC